MTAIAVTIAPGSAVVRAQAAESVDHPLVFEVGAAGEWSLRHGASSAGGTLAAEVTPIENWLELELGMTAVANAGHTELSGDLLFKKPFRLSSTVEFMVGAGPSYTKFLSGPEKGSSWSAEFDLDFMFWPRDRLGWYVEPDWSVNPQSGERSVGVNFGLLIGVL